MQKIEIENGTNILSWCPDIEPEALQQMEVISKLPFVKYCALMPDAHLGMNMPIGGVVACENVIVPDFVGVDIGCGMCAMKSNLNIKDLDERDFRALFNLISQRLPVGFRLNSTNVKNEYKRIYKEKFDYLITKTISKNNTLSDKYNAIPKLENIFFDQLGTLGGGNHFCEIQYDDEGTIWVMIHSGSRKIGKLIGDKYNEMAKDLNKKWHSSCQQIPFLPVDTQEGQCYLMWMEFALQFAFLNRRVMLDVVKLSFHDYLPHTEWVKIDGVDDDINNIINIHHNFASLESHMGKNYWIHRKGATRAFDGMTGIIPGSMGSKSFIVKGKGNKLSLMSCSHGAGRKMGRREFSRLMKDKYDDILDEMKDKGIVHSEFGKFDYGKDKGLKDVSEAPEAYKNIDSVMVNQADLVDIMVELKPKVSIKG